MSKKKIETLNTFRMCAKIKMNRAIDPNKDFISPGGYEMVMDGKTVTFDFEDYTGGRSADDASILEVEVKNPMYGVYPEMEQITEQMLENVSEIKEFFVYTGEPGETDLRPVSLKSVCFMLPDDNYKQIIVSPDVLKKARITSNVIQ